MKCPASARKCNMDQSDGAEGGERKLGEIKCSCEEAKNLTHVLSKKVTVLLQRCLQITM